SDMRRSGRGTLEGVPDNKLNGVPNALQWRLGCFDFAILGGVETKMNPVTRRAEMSKCAHHLPSLVDRSLDLEIHGRCFSGALFDLILDVLPFIERVQSRALNSGDMNEHVPAAALRLNESIALIRIEPLHSTARH